MACMAIEIQSQHHSGESAAVQSKCRLSARRCDRHMSLADQLGRPLRDLRISVTDRCNFRCVYCMPKEVFGKDFQFLDRKALLSFEEIERVARILRTLGIEKIRLTGSEPLVRRNLEALIAKLAAIDGLDLTLT